MIPGPAGRATPGRSEQTGRFLPEWPVAASSLQKPHRKARIGSRYASGVVDGSEDSSGTRKSSSGKTENGVRRSVKAYLPMGAPRED